MIFTTLINGLSVNCRIDLAVDFLDDMVWGGYQIEFHTYNLIVNCQYKFDKTNGAIGLLKGMVERGWELDAIAYSAITEPLQGWAHPYQDSDASLP